MSKILQCDFCNRTSSEVFAIEKYKVKKEVVSMFGERHWQRVDICTDCLEEVRKMMAGKTIVYPSQIEKMLAKPIEKKEKKAKYLSYDKHSCEAWYKCLWCNKTFGTWSVDMKSKRCPHCKEELEGLE